MIKEIKTRRQLIIFGKSGLTFRQPPLKMTTKKKKTSDTVADVSSVYVLCTKTASEIK